MYQHPPKGPKVCRAMAFTQLVLVVLRHDFTYSCIRCGHLKPHRYSEAHPFKGPSSLAAICVLVRGFG